MEGAVTPISFEFDPAETTPVLNWKRCVSFAGVHPDGHMVYKAVTLYGANAENDGACRDCCVRYARIFVGIETYAFSTCPVWLLAAVLAEADLQKRNFESEATYSQSPDRWDR